MRYLLDIAYFFAALAVSPILLHRMIRRNRYRTSWSQRLGRLARKHPDRKCIWIHAVSVGEVNATRTVVDQLATALPDCEIVISTTTDTGFARATALYAPQMEVFFFPLDFSCISRRAFRRLNPSLCVLMELEVWPNFLASADKFGVPVVVVNGRISDHSLRSYRRIRPIAKAIFARISLILAQTEQYAERFAEIGCPRQTIVVTGSLKYDTAQITDKVDGADELAAQLNISPEHPLFVAGATGNDEEAVILDAWKKLIAREGFSHLQLAIVPRKPERFDEVAQLIARTGFNLIRYSLIKNHSTAPPQSNVDNPLSDIPVILGDTMGDLRKFYSLATVVFVGRSLVPMGGSDMMEAAALGKPTIIGPHATNFRQTVDALIEGRGAVLVNDADAFLEALEKCFSDRQYAESIARKGQQVIKQNQGATQKTVDRLASLLTRP